MLERKGEGGRKGNKKERGWMGSKVCGEVKARGKGREGKVRGKNNGFSYC